MDQFDDRHRRPTDDRRGAERPVPGTGHPPHAYVVGMPVAYPIGSEGGGVMMVNGVPQPLSRRSSRLVIGSIVFATCVLPLVIIAAVFFMMPDFDTIFGGAGAPSPAIPSITIQPR